MTTLNDLQKKMGWTDEQAGIVSEKPVKEAPPKKEKEK
jgi:hypothetical protein